MRYYPRFVGIRNLAEWRTIADYWHTNDGAHQTPRDSPIANSEIALVDLSDSNGVIAKRSARQISTSSRDNIVQDSVDVWIARRRFMSADSPFVSNT